MELSSFIPAVAPRIIFADNTPLRYDFQPGFTDVICSRGRRAFEHEGNKRFRCIIESHVEEYKQSNSRVDKSLVVIGIVDMIRHQLTPGGRFVRFCKKNKCYIDIGDNLAREKVGHALRELINGKRTAKGRTNRKSPTVQAPLKVKDPVLPAMCSESSKQSPHPPSLLWMCNTPPPLEFCPDERSNQDSEEESLLENSHFKSNQLKIDVLLGAMQDEMDILRRALLVGATAPTVHEV